jgi:hypothetical protein
VNRVKPTSLSRTKISRSYTKHVPAEYLIEGLSAVGEIKCDLTTAELGKSITLARKYKSLRLYSTNLGAGRPGDTPRALK